MRLSVSVNILPDSPRFRPEQELALRADRGLLLPSGIVIAHKERLADFLRLGTQVIDAKTSIEVILTLLLKNKE